MRFGLFTPLALLSVSPGNLHIGLIPRAGRISGADMTAETAGSEPHSPLPIWLMALGWAPVGLGGAVTLMATPQILASLGVPGERIAALTAFALAPGFVAFLFGPLLDWRFRRKSYAIAFYLLGAFGLAMVLLSARNLAALAFWEFAAQLALTVGSSALGGWFSSLVPRRQAGGLGAWFTVWNLGMGGAAAMAAVPLIRATSLETGAVILGVWTAAPILLLLWLPCKAADGRLAQESVKAFAGDVAAILRSRLVLWTLLIFLSPAASFALVNIMGGLGGAFATPEQTVSLLLGTGGLVAGIFGSLAMPLVERWITPRYLYLWVGLAGAVLTLAAALLPHTPATFAFAVLAENLGQAAGFSVAYAIMLRTIGPDDPLAATQFALMNSAICLPLTYMQILDAEGLAQAGVAGGFFTDAAISASACLLLLFVFRTFRRTIPPG